MSIGVGIIGAGVISTIYAKNIQNIAGAKLVAFADLDAARAQAKADEFGAEALSVAQLLDDPRIQAVVNLTVPSAHAEVSRSVALAGKHVYSEKPLAMDVQSGRAILTAASEHGVRVGCAPDTFLGGGLQTSRKVLDDGWIGTPVAGTAFMMGHGPEGWHPDPNFFYQPGGGPLFDMGPYYLTALIFLLGPIRRVAGAARISFPERIITSAARYGERIQVNTPTHVAAHLEFVQGSIVTLITSFDVWSAALPRIEIYGSEGTLSVPDPNTFGGPVRVRLGRSDQWTELPLTHPFAENSRGIGLADLLASVGQGRSPRASGDLAYHVLEAMEGILRSSADKSWYEMTSTVERPLPMPRDASWRNIY